MYAPAITHVKTFGPVSKSAPTQSIPAVEMAFLGVTLMASIVSLTTITKMIFTALWTPEMWVVVIAGAISSISTAVIAVSTNRTNNQIKLNQALRNLQREVDTLERRETAEKVTRVVKRAHEDIKQEIAANTAVNEAAIKVANGHNEKIVALSEQVAQTVAIVAKAPAHVVVDNPPDSPVQTHQVS